MTRVALLAIAAAACAKPSERFHAAATRLGLAHETVAGAPFRHVVFRNAAPPSNVLHVYLDGDGVPWIDGRPGADPTPRNTLVLKLMRIDASPSVYVGRPCYHQARVEREKEGASKTGRAASQPKVGKGTKGTGGRGGGLH